MKNLIEQRPSLAFPPLTFALRHRLHCPATRAALGFGAIIKNDAKHKQEQVKRKKEEAVSLALGLFIGFVVVGVLCRRFDRRPSSTSPLQARSPPRGHCVSDGECPQPSFVVPMADGQLCQKANGDRKTINFFACCSHCIHASMHPCIMHPARGQVRDGAGPAGIAPGQKLKV